MKENFAVQAFRFRSYLLGPKNDISTERMIDTSDTVFRLMAVLKLAALVEAAMFTLVARKVVEPDAAMTILNEVTKQPGRPRSACYALGGG